MLVEPNLLDNQQSREVDTLVEESLAGLGYELLLLELKRARAKWIVRVYIDSPNGVTLDDCTKVSSYLSDILDAKDPIPGPYVLEVSSPGLNRPLRRPEHFRRYLGQSVQLTTSRRIGGRRRFKGILKSCDGSDDDAKLLLLVDGNECVIRLAEVEKANLLYRFSK